MKKKLLITCHAPGARTQQLADAVLKGAREIEETETVFKRAFDTTAEYRTWCEHNLPDWLGYGRIRLPSG